MATNRKFPLKTALALATCVLSLAAYRRFVDHGKGLSPAIFSEAAHVSLMRHAPVAVVATPPVAPKIQTAKQKSRTLAQISPYFIDDDGSLDPFFAALHRLEEPADGKVTDTVTILHYGDSPTTADLITGDVRSLLQQRFGDAGHGYLLTAKPWAWYQHWGVDISDHNWTISTAVGKGREESYGIGGASFEGAAGASSHISLKDTNQTAVDIAYLARPNGGTVSVAANGNDLDSFSTAADAPHPAWHTVALPAGTKSIDLKVASGSARLFGESFGTGHRGLLYDSLGLNGASTTVLSNGFNASAWSAGLRHEKPQLVVINYGTNESGFGSFVDKQYEPTLRGAIARIRTALPGVPIVVMSPMDRGRRTGVDQIETYDTIPRLVAIQRRVAAELHCGFFDTFDAMGGEGTMARWYTGHPRLVAGDLIHPTPQGASIVAQLFVKDLSLGYERYLRRQAGVTLPPRPTETAPAQPTPEPAKIPVEPLAKPAVKPSAAHPEEPPPVAPTKLEPPPVAPTEPEPQPAAEPPKAETHDAPAPPQ
ncbi:Lysophospholipase L1 [Granulicella rosea]|uniref:Lysophospholipase L1 n=1 Tax=Granulicella rosea TaxID=474952 RepID=A0A239M355_9BACT|nr:GDSL-type esterase/lipase family protein [Granulicella rosea]SNT37237.1 Lysophospholipase L1 [Granulicella rosea]